MSNNLTRRQFLKTTGLGAAAGLCWVYGGNVALSQVRWEDEKETTPLWQVDNPALSEADRLGKGRRAGYPRMAFDGKGILWCVWVEQRDGEEGVYLMPFRDEEFGQELKLSGGTAAACPAITRAGSVMAIVWAEKQSQEWVVRRAYIRDGEPSSFREISRGRDLAWNLAIAPVGDQSALIAFERQHNNQPAIFVYPDRAGNAPTGHMARYLHCERPALAGDGEGNAWLAWDQMEGQGSRAVYIQKIPWDPTDDKFSEENVGKPIRATYHPAMNIAPALDLDSENRLWIAYHSNRKGKDQWDIPRWIYLECYDGEKFLEPAAPPKDKNLRKEGTDQSFEFPRVACARDGKVIISGRPSHNFCLQHYQGAQWSPLYRLPEDGWGGRGQILDMAISPEGELYVVRRDIGMNLLQKVSGLIGEERVRPQLEASPGDEAFGANLVNIVKAPERWDPLDDFENAEAPLYGYFGDIHGHTWMSDGMGDVDEYYIARRDYYEQDFASLTDHDTFVGKSILPSEWEFIKEMTQAFQEEGRFVTLFGQEWTTARYPTNAGHKCIYSLRQDIPLFDHDYSRYRRTEGLYPALKEWGAIIIPHHTGWTGTDWENFDPEVQPLAEICSNHGVFEYQGNTPIPHRGGARGCFLQDGLKAGHRFGIIGGSDSHGLIWHHHAGWKRDCNRTGLAGVLAPNLSREAIFEAMKRRRTFGTTGIDRKSVV